MGQEHDGQKTSEWYGASRVKKTGQTLSTANTQCNATRCTLNTSDTPTRKSASASEFENSIKLSKIHREYSLPSSFPIPLPVFAGKTGVTFSLFKRIVSFGDVFAAKIDMFMYDCTRMNG